MILRKVVDQFMELQQKFPAMGEVEVRDYDNADCAVASIEYDEDTGRIYIGFEKVEDAK